MASKRGFADCNMCRARTQRISTALLHTPWRAKVVGSGNKGFQQRRRASRADCSVPTTSCSTSSTSSPAGTGTCTGGLSQLSCCSPMPQDRQPPLCTQLAVLRRICRRSTPTRCCAGWASGVAGDGSFWCWCVGAHLPPRDQAQQRGLAHAVGPHQPIAPPRRDRHVRVLQQHFALRADCHAVHLRHNIASFRSRHRHS